MDERVRLAKSTGDIAGGNSSGSSTASEVAASTPTGAGPCSPARPREWTAGTQRAGEPRGRNGVKIGILGAGMIGGTLGRLWASAGHEVQRLARMPLVDELHPNLEGGEKHLEITAAAPVGSGSGLRQPLRDPAADPRTRFVQLNALPPEDRRDRLVRATYLREARARVGTKRLVVRARNHGELPLRKHLVGEGTRPVVPLETRQLLMGHPVVLLDERRR
jgi:hypothetical protein